MLPQIDNQMSNETRLIELPSKTYKLNIYNNEYINPGNYKEINITERKVLDNTDDKIFKNIQIQGNTAINKNNNIIGVSNIYFEIINLKYPSEYQLFSFASLVSMFRKDDIYDYLSDKGIVLRLQKVNNELIIRKEPMIIPYTDGQKNAYEKLKNLHTYKERYNYKTC